MTAMNMTKLIKPLLARDVNETKLKFPCYLTPKIDGSFAFVQNSLLYARSLKQHENKHVTAQYSNPLFEGLRGELIAGFDPTAKDLCRNSSKALRTIEGKPETSLWCFDYVTPDTVNLSWLERQKLLLDKVQQLRVLGYEDIGYIEPVKIHNLDEYINARNHFMNQGYEGVVVRNPDSKHKEGRSSEVKADLWRWKPWATAEIKVTRLGEEQKNNNEAKTNELGHTERSTHKDNLEGKNTLGYIVGTLLEPLKDFAGDIVATAGTELTIATGNLTEKECKYYWDNPDEMLGMIVEFEYMSFGLKEKPRFAQFRRIRSEKDL